MRIKFIIFLLFPIICFSQSKDYKKKFKSEGFKFFTDNLNPILNSNISLEDIIFQGNKFGYRLLKNNDNNYLYNNGFFNLITLIKDINGSATNSYELIPQHQVGQIYKRYYWSGDNIGEAYIFKVQTEIKLIESLSTYVSSSEIEIRNYYNSIKNFISENIKLNYTISSNSREFDSPFEPSPNLFTVSYDLAEKIKYFKKGKYLDSEYIFKTASSRTTEKGRNDTYIDYQYLVFSFEDPYYEIERLRYNNHKNTLDNNKKTTDALKYTIGGVDIRDMNIYDLEAMVNIFLEDCKKNNILPPSINTLKATFEPLEESTIAVAYAMNDDSKIIIKVDPSNWANSSKPKRWYILYHELGHDVLNLNHGEGGKMMYNFADREYTWDEYFTDKQYMFNSYKN